jgi:F-type H+-transporting ATPase subunit delta
VRHQEAAPFAKCENEGAKDIGRVDVSEAAISTGVAQRYATAVFELAKEEGVIAAVEKDLDVLADALNDSSDFAAMIGSPVYSRAEQAKAMTALASKMGLSVPMAGVLGVMAEKRRLFVLPQLISALRAAIAEDKGEVTAEVTAAKAMTKTQQDKLAKALKASIGKDVKINLAVDEDLIGGLVVKVGSKMIDSSIRSRLNALQNSMKEV